MADLGFSRGGVNPQGGAVNLLSLPVFKKISLKMEEIGPECITNAIPLDLPMDFTLICIRCYLSEHYKIMVQEDYTL